MVTKALISPTAKPCDQPTKRAYRLGMAKFFFHIRQNRVVFEDTRGGEFPDLRTAWNWAVSDVRAMITACELEGPVDQHWLEICDVTGAMVASLPFVRVARPN